jgi:hypothetical protein
MRHDLGVECYQFPVVAQMHFAEFPELKEPGYTVALTVEPYQRRWAGYLIPLIVGSREAQSAYVAMRHLPTAALMTSNHVGSSVE